MTEDQQYISMPIGDPMYGMLNLLQGSQRTESVRRILLSNCMQKKERRKWVAATVLAFCLFLGFPTRVSCSTIVAHYVGTSQRARVTTEMHARPLGGVRVEVYRHSGRRGGMSADEPMLVLFSDPNGQLVLPKLPHGKYALVALAKPDLRDDVYLNISIGATIGRTTKLTLELTPYEPPPTSEQTIAAAERSQDVKRVTEFRGVVNGGPQVSIDVLFKGTGGKKYAARLYADEFGKFTADLPEGDYVALFNARYFRTKVVVLTISQTGSNDGLTVKLEVPSCTE
jgi:hypothetical protein